MKASGRYWTPSTWDGPPPRGAWVGYKYGSNGHACLSLGDGRIATTDPGNGAMVGIEDLDYPNKWGASGWDVWTDQYNGVRFDVGVGPGDVYVEKLRYGQEDSDSVRRLQQTLNNITLSGGSNLPITGNYFDQTMNEVSLWQDQKATDKTVTDGAYVTNEQAEQLFSGTGNEVIHDDDQEAPPEVPTTPPDSGEEPETISFPLGIEYWYSGKPAGFNFSGSYKKIAVPSWAPKKDGITFSMIYLNVDGEGEYRVRLVREGPDDPTAYQTVYNKSGDNGLLTHVWFEAGEANRKLHWEVSSMDGDTLTVGTHYVKFFVIPYEVIASIGEMAMMYQSVRPHLKNIKALIKILEALKDAA